jgi:hypothetical protein
MRTFLISVGLFALLAALPVFAQSAPSDAASSHDGVPNGWSIAGTAAKKYRYGTTADGAGRGAFIASLQTPAPSAPDDFATVMQTVASDAYRGKRVRLSALLSTAMDPAAGGHAALWLRVDDEAGKVVGFDNMNSRPVTGTSARKRYEIVLDVPERSADIAFGFMQIGSGTTTAADFKLEQVDSSVAITAPRTLPTAPVNLDFSER